MAKPTNSKSMLEELRECWLSLPDKPLLLVLLAAWFALFHFLGNSTFGYIKADSLFSWMHYVFTTSPDDDLCLYIPLVVLGLLIWKRQELTDTPKKPWWPAIGLVLLALLLHVAGYAVQQARISILAWALGIYAITGLLWGPTWLKNTFFPMFLLGFMIPIASVSDGLTLPLRLLATKVSVALAHHGFGIPVFENGAQILGPEGTALYEVAPACSGIRSLISMTILMIIFGFVIFKSWWRRFILLACAMPVALLGNITRLTIVIIVGEAFGQDKALAVETNLGFITFALGVLCMLLVSYWLDEGKPKKPVPSGNIATE
ncbi:MAG: hypothetical protein RI897_1292 [Verrucomicrobiota bacterium]|jgi:exosortase